MRKQTKAKQTARAGQTSLTGVIDLSRLLVQPALGLLGILIRDLPASNAQQAAGSGVCMKECSPTACELLHNALLQQERQQNMHIW